MKKLKTTLKTMLLAVVVLVMTQGCIPTVPGGNPTPNLSGKIKSFKIFGTDTLNATNYIFNYDASGNVSTIDWYSSTWPTGVTSTIYTITVERATDKVSIKYGYTKQVFYLKPGTNLIDSNYTLGYDVYSNTYGFVSKEIVVRDNNNNLQSITHYFHPNATVGLIRNNFVYQDGNIISYDMPNQMPLPVKYEFKYDLTKLSKVNTNQPVIGFTNESMSFPAVIANYVSGFTIDVECLGISIGNTSKNIIESYRDVYNNPSASFTIPPAYSIYTPVQTRVVSLYSGFTLENNYY